MPGETSDWETTLEIGDATLEVNPKTEHVYEVTLQGNYIKTTEETAKWPSTLSWPDEEEITERFISEEITSIPSERFISAELVEREPGQNQDHITVAVTRKKWFAIGGEVTTEPDALQETFDTEYFEELLTEHGIDPDAVTDFERATINQKTVRLDE